MNMSHRSMVTRALAVCGMLAAGCAAGDVPQILEVGADSASRAGADEAQLAAGELGRGTQALRVDAPRPPLDPCSRVRCPADTHCVSEGRRARCEPDEPQSGPFCGGIAGIACPGAGTCVDDPTDSCDPARGGADCGGVCTCGNVLLLCVEGTVFDPSPDVCSCVPVATDPCAAVRCPTGTQCRVRGGEPLCLGVPAVNPCAAVLCVAGTQCEVQGGQPVCVPVEPPNPCAAVLCPVGSVCVASAGGGRCVPRY